MEDQKSVPEQLFLETYDQYSTAIYRHCFFRVFSEPRAEELTQEAFMKFWLYIKGGNEVKNPKALLYKIATNLVIDYSRKKKELSLEEVLEKAPAQEPFYEGAEKIETDIAFHEVLDTMHELPEEARELITMRYVDDMTPAEIAEVLGISANNVSVKINRAMTQLKSILNKE